MTPENDQYTLFDGAEETYPTVLPSNENIRSVCRILTEAIFKSDDERLYYADIGDIPPDGYDKSGSPRYSFPNKWPPGPFWAALAQELFYGCPDLVKFSQPRPVITDRKAYDKLNRGEVRRAFDDFLGKFAATPYEVTSLLSLLDSDRIRKIMSRNNLPSTPEEKPASTGKP